LTASFTDEDAEIWETPENRNETSLNSLVSALKDYSREAPEIEKYIPRQQAETDGNAQNEKTERELTQWLRDTWIAEGELGGTRFFTRLKQYAGKKGSPIIKHYGAGKDAGFRWETSKGSTGEMKKNTLLNKVSIFKNKP
jgi:hypothetical protein